MSKTLEDLASAMTTKAVTSDELKLANEMIASYLEDSARSLKEAKELARQVGVPFKFDIEGLVVAFDPAVEEAELTAASQAKDDEDWCSSDEDWSNSNC